jgi:hypothetical protein
MTHFEFVSVAAALVYALAIGKLASGIAMSLQTTRFYWVHATWMTGLLLVCVLQWWAIWDMRMIDWTPLKFLWLLTLPGLLLIRSSLLVGADPQSIDSYETYFYQIRVRFFTLGIFTACQILLNSWILSEVPLSTFLPIHAQGLLVLSMCVIGLIFPQPSIQGAIALSSILGPIVGFSIL